MNTEPCQWNKTSKSRPVLLLKKEGLFDSPLRPIFENLILFKRLCVKKKENISFDTHFTHFELLECTVSSLNNNEWSCYFGNLVLLPEELLIIAIWMTKTTSMRVGFTEFWRTMAHRSKWQEPLMSEVVHCTWSSLGTTAISL